MKLRLILLTASLIATAIVIAACQPLQPQQPQENKSAECTSDADCGVGGCSGQICAPAAKAAGIITTCEYRAEYDCLKLTSCGCAGGKCAWKQTGEYKSCLDHITSPQQQQQ